MDIQKTWMLLQIESLSRLHPKLAAITNGAMSQLEDIAGGLGGKPKSIHPVQQFANVRPASTVAPAERELEVAPEGVPAPSVVERRE